MTYHSILSGKYRRYGRGVRELFDVRTIHKNMQDSTRFLRGVQQAKVILRQIQPDVVFVNGGYVGLPVGLAASLLRIPLIIHESDTVMGLTNRILARRASIVATGFPVSVYPKKLQGKLVHVGNLVSEVFSSKTPYTRSKKDPVLLVMGGSTGARIINETIWHSLTTLATHVQIIHQTGEHSITEANAIRSQLPKHLRTRYAPFAFTESHKLAEYMCTADIVISRAGANSIFELAAAGKPAIIIPLATAANNHQVRNATHLRQHQAAEVLTESELTPERLQEVILHLIKHTTIRTALGRNLLKLATPRAASNLAQIILKKGKH